MTIYEVLATLLHYQPRPHRVRPKLVPIDCYRREPLFESHHSPASHQFQGAFVIEPNRPLDYDL